MTAGEQSTTSFSKSSYRAFIRAAGVLSKLPTVCVSVSGFRTSADVQQMSGRCQIQFMERDNFGKTENGAQLSTGRSILAISSDAILKDEEVQYLVDAPNGKNTVLLLHLVSKNPHKSAVESPVEIAKTLTKSSIPRCLIEHLHLVACHRYSRAQAPYELLSISRLLYTCGSC